MPRYLVDTNVLLRFLLEDHPELSPMAVGLFREAADGNCTLILTDMALAEAVWVLTSHYGIPHQEVAKTLARLITRPGMRCWNTDLLLDSLSRLEATGCDFLDCYLAAQAKASGDTVASFDTDFRKFTDVKLWKPETAGKPE